MMNASIYEQQPELARPSDGLGTTTSPQLAVDIARVFLDGTDGDYEFFRDGLVGITNCQEFQDFHFARGQWLDQAI